MAWVLVVVTAVLAVLVLVLGLFVVRLRGRIEALETAQAASRYGNWSSEPVRNDQFPHLDEPAAGQQYLVPRVVEPVATVPAPVFADLVLRETVVQTAALFQGVRRALAPETRNRIRFHVRQEVKRSRKQRRTELREVRREWQARQRAAQEPAA